MKVTAMGLNQVAMIVGAVLLALAAMVLFFPGGLGRRLISEFSQEIYVVE